MRLGQDMPIATGAVVGADVVRNLEHHMGAEGNDTRIARGDLAHVTVKGGTEREAYPAAPPAEGPRPGLQRLRALGVVSDADLDAFGKLMKVRSGIRRGDTIVGKRHSGKYFTVLLEGLACMATRHEEGGRQICGFSYPGDFLALHGFLDPDSTKQIEVEALSNCSIGTIDRDLLEQAMQRRPALAQALWRAAMVDASISRQRLVMAQWPALQRVAHLLCEQLSRRDLSYRGLQNPVIPLRQMDVADTVGLSVVHTNRIFQELRDLGVLSKGRLIEVVSTARLQELAAFDGRYLDLGESLSQWDLRIDD